MSEDNTRLQYLTFHLSDEQYGIGVLQVREVLEIPKITRVPRMPAFMKGVINIRGSVIPVIDLRLKLGLDEADRTVNSRVIIIEVVLSDETISLGILVDSVQEVIEIGKQDIAPPPQLGTSVDAAFIQGIAKIEQDFVIIVDIDRIFIQEELKSLDLAETSQDLVSAAV